MPEPVNSERLFFALWPTPAVRRNIAQTFAGCGVAGQGKPVVMDNLHLTLHFLGSVPARRVDCFVRHAARVKLSSFQIELDRFGYFQKTRVFWLGCTRVPARLRQLHENLGESLASCGYSLENRAYRPHVTLARKLRPTPVYQPEHAVNWRVDEFALVVSTPGPVGVEYKVRNRFKLSN